MSPGSIVNNTLESCKNVALKDNVQDCGPDYTVSTSISMSAQCLTMEAYTYLYHMNGGYIDMKDPFWDNFDIQAALSILRFDEYVWIHRVLCSAKGCGYRFLFLFKSCEGAHIHSDPGDNDDNCIVQYRLKGPVLTVPPWMIVIH